jgi:hypothetical protein
MKNLFLICALVGLFPLAAHADRMCTPHHFLSAANNNAATYSNGTGPMGLCGDLVVTNTTSTTGMDLRFYDVTGIPSCGSSVGVVWNIPVPTAATAADVGGISIPIPAVMTFQRGIGVCLTGAVSDTDNSNAATGVQVNFGTNP